MSKISFQKRKSNLVETETPFFLLYNPCDTLPISFPPLTPSPPFPKKNPEQD